MELPLTARLRLRPLDLGDASFILDLVNQPSWLRYIGDKQVRSLEDARRYLREGPLAMYTREGFGLYAVERRQDAATLGLCGLIRRAQLEDVDLGFAFLPEYWGQGYALEAAAAVRDHARDTLALPALAAITLPDNASSIRLLEKLGMAPAGRVRLSADEAELLLYRQRLQDP